MFWAIVLPTFGVQVSLCSMWEDENASEKMWDKAVKAKCPEFLEGLHGSFSAGKLNPKPNNLNPKP